MQKSQQQNLNIESQKLTDFQENSPSSELPALFISYKKINLLFEHRWYINIIITQILTNILMINCYSCGDEVISSTLIRSTIHNDP